MADESDWTPLFKSPPWRFSIRQLLIGIALIAVGLFALRSASAFWVMALHSLTLLALSLSPLVALYRQGPNRAFWIGFATIGWFYMLILPYFAPLRADQLLTTHLSSRLHEWMYPTEAMPSNSGSWQSYAPNGPPGTGMESMSMGGMSTKSRPMMPGSGSMSGSGSSLAAIAAGPSPGDFMNVAHSLWTLLLAFCGGQFCKWLYATRPQPTTRPAPPQA